MCGAGARGQDCALQTRLHQLEDARARELEAHGRRVRELQRAADASSDSAREAQLELARLRTDRCRLDADVAGLKRRVRQLEDALDLARTEHAKAIAEKDEACKAKDRRVAGFQEELASGQRERQQLIEERIELRATIEANRKEIDALTTTAEQRLQMVQQQANENGLLKATITNNETQMEQMRRHEEQQSRELERTQVALKSECAERHMLARELERALQTRNRVITWRRNWIDRFVRELMRRELFYSWKTLWCEAVHARNKDAASKNALTCQKLQDSFSRLGSQCVHMRNELVAGKMQWMEQHKALETYREEITTTKFPQLEVIANRVRERNEMSANDAESRAFAVFCRCKTQKRAYKQHESVLIELIALKRSQAWCGLVFGRWKDWYLRGVVGETTHAAMVSQLSHSEPRPRPLSEDESRTRSSISSEADSGLTPTSSQHSHSSRAMSSSSQGEKARPKSNVCVEVGEETWQRWRRVASAGIVAPMKSRVLLSSPVPSPSNGSRDASPLKVDERRRPSRREFGL